MEDVLTVDTRKLDKWADLLLDTGKRNRLINFRDTRTATAEVLLPSADALFDKVDGGGSFEVFDPKLAEDDDLDDYPEDPQAGGMEEHDADPDADPDARDERAEFLALYSGKSGTRTRSCCTTLPPARSRS